MTREHRNPQRKRYLVWYVLQGSHDIVAPLHISTLLKQLPCCPSHFPSDTKFQSFSFKSNPFYEETTFCSSKVLLIPVSTLWKEDIGAYVVVSFFFISDISVFLLFLGMVMYANEVETKEKEKLPQIKKITCNIQQVWYLRHGLKSWPWRVVWVERVGWRSFHSEYMTNDVASMLCSYIKD